MIPLVFVQELVKEEDVKTYTDLYLQVVCVGLHVLLCEGENRFVQHSLELL